MSPEVNGNPPSVTKRKKNRDKKLHSAEGVQNFDLNMPSCNYFPSSQYPYSNFTIPEMPHTYYPFVNYPNPSEPMSLPVYPMNYSGYTCLGSAVGSAGNISRQSTLSNHTFNIEPEKQDYMSLPVVSVDTNEESKRRFSDPGLPNDSDSGSNCCEETVRKLTHHIHSLKESNHRLSREVMDLRIELNLLKQQQTTRHYEREYEPGMLADVIREVREAARVREDALLARVKHIMEEKHLSVVRAFVSLNLKLTDNCKRPLSIWLC